MVFQMRLYINKKDIVENRDHPRGVVRKHKSYYRAAHAMVEDDGYMRAVRAMTMMVLSVMLCYGLFCLCRSGEVVVRMLICFDSGGTGSSCDETLGRRIRIHKAKSEKGVSA